MKYTNIFIAFIATFALSLYGSTYAAELGVDSIDVIDANTLSVTLSENPNLEVGEIQGEITILNDIKLRGGFMSEDDASSVELILEDALNPNTVYSLLTVSGSEGSIDFTTGDDVEGFTAENITITDDQDIMSIEVIDDRTIMIQYKDELSSSIFEYKLLAESEVVKIEKPDYFLSEIIISVEPPLKSEEDYILMFIEMQDVEGNYLEFDTGIYDFTSPVLEETDEIIISDEELVSESLIDDMIINDDQEEMSLEAAGDEVSLEKDAASTMDVEQVASMVSETPDTGAQTWVLILLTLIINSFYYLSRRKAKNLAV